MKTTISFSVDQNQKDHIKKFCKINNMNLSHFIRSIVLDRIEYLEHKKKGKK
jgi:hypothetical protein